MDATVEQLNAYLAGESFLGSPVRATLEDYRQCGAIPSTDLDPMRFPHLCRWHAHVSYMMKRYPKVDPLGDPVPAGEPPCLANAGIGPGSSRRGGGPQREAAAPMEGAGASLCVAAGGGGGVDDGPPVHVVNAASFDNPFQGTGAEHMRLLDEGREACLERLLQTPRKFPLTVYHHAPVYTCDQAEKLCPADRNQGGKFKNLFLRDKKKNFFLFSALSSTQIEMNKLKIPGAKSGGLSFASSDDLMRCLKLIPGSVTPFGLLNDVPADGEEPKVKYCLDAKALEYEFFQFHPNACHSTVSIHRDDFTRFITEQTKHQVEVLSVESPGGA